MHPINRIAAFTDKGSIALIPPEKSHTQQMINAFQTKLLFNQIAFLT